MLPRIHLGVLDRERRNSPEGEEIVHKEVEVPRAVGQLFVAHGVLVEAPVLFGPCL